MTNDADRKGSCALAVEGGADRAVLCAPERGAAGERRVLRHLRLEGQVRVGLKAVVDIGVQVGCAPRFHHLTTRRCGAAFAGAARSGARVKATTRSRAFVRRAISVANEMSSADAAS